MFEDTGELTVTGTSVKVSPLIPGTRYHFKVSAVTPTGRGAEVSAFGTTQENEGKAKINACCTAEIKIYRIVPYLNVMFVSPAKLAYFQLRMTPVYNCLELSVKIICYNNHVSCMITFNLNYIFFRIPT